MHDNLGNRMKTHYEDRTRYYLPRKSFIIIRVDGKAFHSYTKKLQKPFDEDFMGAMAGAAREVFKQAQGAQLAYIQSDEASFLLTDFEKDTTEAWFDNNLSKMCSVSASIMTAHFMIHRILVSGDMRPAVFDSRVYSIPKRIESCNYMIWRQNDCVRNSIISLAQSQYSHKELHGKSCNQMQDMLHERGINWNDLEDNKKRGTVIYKSCGELVTVGAPIFNCNPKDFLDNIVPHNET